MSKAKKLFCSPYLFFRDFYYNRKNNRQTYNNLMLCFHINDWKREFIETIFSDKKIVYVPFKVSDKQLIEKWIPMIIKNNATVLVWGMNLPEIVANHNEINKKKINIIYVEDGFIRSIGLGANHTLPASLNFDSQTLYFDSSKQSDLEYLLNTYNFDEDSELMNRADNLKNMLIKTGISKYNHSNRVADVRSIYGKKDRKRILVVGQVEDDASIKYGSKIKYTNNDLVRIAVFENPDAQVIYKPHPDVLHQKRQKLSDPREVSHICQILSEDIPLAQSFETIDHVYTISSQAGFEALLRNIKVTTLGCPFYSGWGCTDDRQINKRRNRKLTVNQILAAAYILYPSYYHPLYKSKKVTVEEILDYLNIAKQQELRREQDIIGKILVRNTNKIVRSSIIQHFHPHKVVFPKLSEMKTVYQDNEFFVDTFNNGGEMYLTENSKFLYPGFLSRYFKDQEYVSLMVDAKNLNSEFYESDLKRLIDTNALISMNANDEHHIADSLNKLRKFYQLICSKYNRFSVDSDFIMVIACGSSIYDVSGENFYCDFDILKIARYENKEKTIVFATNYNISKEILANIGNIVPYRYRDRFCEIDFLSLSLQAKKVYTINDAAAFHRIFMGVKPIIFGKSWFSHIGLSEDRMYLGNIDKENKIQLSVERFFYTVFLQYTSYIHPLYKNKCSFDDFIDYMITN